MGLKSNVLSIPAVLLIAMRMSTVPQIFVVDATQFALDLSSTMNRSDIRVDSMSDNDSYSMAIYFCMDPQNL